MESIVIRKLCYNKLNYAKDYIWKFCKKRPLLFKLKQYLKTTFGTEGYGKDLFHHLKHGGS